MSQVIRFVHHSHFDPIWRRCWQRPIETDGRVYQPYAVVEEAVIDKWIEMAESEGCTFGEGQAAVWRSYFERNPDKQARVRELYEQGKLDLFTCGEVIGDNNMPAGETSIRNLLYGIMSMKEMFGDAGHSPIGWNLDNFGNCGQLPQMLKSLGVEMIFRFSYNEPDGDVWRGMDGSEIHCREPWQLAMFGVFHKYPPCPQCGGAGCGACGNYGLDFNAGGDTPETLIRTARDLKEDVGLVFFLTEEVVPQKAHAEALRRLREEGMDARYGTYRELLEICPLPQDPKVSTKRELNPAQSGTLVTRIKLKQRLRQVEYALMGLENLSAMLGEAYDPAPVRDIWRTVAFTTFHDAITSTHVDAAYDELMDMFDKVEAYTGKWAGELLKSPELSADAMELAVYNPLPFERPAGTLDLPAHLPAGTYSIACGNRTITEAAELAGGDTIAAPALPPGGPVVLTLRKTDAKPAAVGAFENDHLAVEFDERWLKSITLQADGTKVTADHQRFRPLEITAEPDYGDPWNTFADTTHGVFTWALSPYVTGHELSTVAGGKRLRYTGRYEGKNKYIDQLEFQADFFLWDHVPYIDLHFSLAWDTRSTRLRLTVPVPGGANRGRYEVPFGQIERERYQGSFSLCGTNGDWPAQTWVDVEVDDAQRVALLNTGTPSHRVVDGLLTNSFLRSPDCTTLLNETAYYEFHDSDGMRDAGSHRFRWRLWPHAADVPVEELTRAGMGFNMPCRFAAPAAETETETEAGAGEGAAALPFEMDIPGVVPFSVKRSEDGAAWTVRLAEIRGAETSGAFRWKNGGQVHAANMLEEPGEPAGEMLSFRGFEIKTLRVEG